MPLPPAVDFDAQLKLAQAQAQAQANAQALQIVLEAKDEALRIRKDAENSMRVLEQSLRQREIVADRKDAGIEVREKRVVDTESLLDKNE